MARATCEGASSGRKCPASRTTTQEWAASTKVASCAWSTGDHAPSSLPRIDRTGTATGERRIRRASRDGRRAARSALSAVWGAKGRARAARNGPDCESRRSREDGDAHDL